MQEDQQLPIKRFFSSFGPLQRIVVLAAIIVLAGSAGLIIHHAKTTPSQSAGKYVSTTDGFSIKFRTKPKVDHANVTNSTAGSVAQTTYETASPDGKAAYAVSVVQYPPAYVFNKTTLQQVAASQAKNSIDGKLLSESYVSYLGRETLESSYKTVSGGNTYTVYGISLANNHKVYTVYSIGASKTDFSAYVKTFAFIK